VPLRDASLLRDVPPGTPVLRARTLEPGYAAKQLAWEAVANREPKLAGRLKRRGVAAARRLLVPDPQLLWLPGAHVALATELATSPPDVVFISGPPFSQFLLAGLARLRPRTAVVLDYRDEWTMTAGGYEMSASARVNERLESAVLRQAHAVTTATDEFREALLTRFRWLDPERVVVVPNGYDSDDFPATLPGPSGGRFLITYSGTVFRLTSAAGFLAGLRLLHEREPELARLLEVRFVGRIVETEQAYFDGSEQLGVQRLGYLDHEVALSHLSESHLALCILDEVEGVERIYPAKIFEIMRIGRPCLALTPEGALSRLVRRHRLGEVVPPRDASAIASSLAARLRAFHAGEPAVHAPIDLERYDRRILAGRFAEVFAKAHDDANQSRSVWSA
jgi:glycosyltransferase involved in cell wall biosynthesis